MATKSYRCDWLAIHFATAEKAAQFSNEAAEIIRRLNGEPRLLRGGEKIPVCKVEV